DKPRNAPKKGANRRNRSASSPTLEDRDSAFTGAKGPRTLRLPRNGCSHDSSITIGASGARLRVPGLLEHSYAAIAGVAPTPASSPGPVWSRGAARQQRWWEAPGN